MDIILTFYSAYEDFEMKLIDDKKLIACNYLQGWFLIDFVSIFPLDFLLSFDNDPSSSSYNQLFRILRLGKLQKLSRVF
jgi:hypothetical protein